MKIGGYSETIPKPEPSDVEAARTCRKCHHANMDPSVLDREKRLGAEIWLCEFCGAENVEVTDETTEPMVQSRLSNSEKLGEEVRRP